MDFFDGELSDSSASDIFEVADNCEREKKAEKESKFFSETTSGNKENLNLDVKTNTDEENHEYIMNFGKRVTKQFHVVFEKWSCLDVESRCNLIVLGDKLLMEAKKHSTDRELRMILSKIKKLEAENMALRETNKNNVQKDKSMQKVESMMNNIQNLLNGKSGGVFGSRVSRITKLQSEILECIRDKQFLEKKIKFLRSELATQENSSPGSITETFKNISLSNTKKSKGSRHKIKKSRKKRSSEDMTEDLKKMNMQDGIKRVTLLDNYIIAVPKN